MRKFKNASKPFQCEFYQVYTQDGVKMIHLFGFTYESDTYWAGIECVRIIGTLKEFIEGYKLQSSSFVDDAYESASQYQKDMTAEEAVDYINHYFDGHGADKVCDFSELRNNTKDGNYICIEY